MVDLVLLSKKSRSRPKQDFYFFFTLWPLKQRKKSKQDSPISESSTISDSKKLMTDLNKQPFNSFERANQHRMSRGFFLLYRNSHAFSCAFNNLYRGVYVVGVEVFHFSFRYFSQLGARYFSRLAD